MVNNELIKVGTITEYMARFANVDYFGDVYADPGLIKHIRNNHEHELPKEVIDNAFKYISEIIKEPEYIGAHPKLGGLEFIKKYSKNLLVGVNLDKRNNYLYVATLHPIEDYKIYKRLNNRLFRYIPDPSLETKEQVAVFRNSENNEVNSNFERKSNSMYDEKVNELMEQLEKGIKETMDSERFKAFLRVQTQFHNYSFNNAMLIYMQRPDATRVAGFQTWKNKFERNVLKGEKGIGIFAPCPYKYEKPVEVKNPATGEVEKQNKIVEGISFKKVTVFDIKQTDGKPLPKICNELQGNSINAANIIKAVKGMSEIPIIEKVITSGAKGYYSRLENIIAIKDGMSLDQSAKTHVHEYCHSKIHNSEASKLFDRATKEVQAEGVAYIVCNRFGLDTSEYSFDYLASWSGGKELKELKQSFDIIQKTSNDIIEKMEKVLSKNIELQQSPVKIQILWTESNQLKAGQVLDIEEADKLFTKLYQEQAELRKSNPDIDYSKVTAGEQVAYVPYLKTSFEVQLADGRKSEARFDFGESGYKDLYECIKRECYIDVKEYIRHNELIDGRKTVMTNYDEFKNKLLDEVKAKYSYSPHNAENLYRNEIIQTVGYHENSNNVPTNLRITYGTEIEKDVFHFKTNDFSKAEDKYTEIQYKEQELKQQLNQERQISNKIKDMYKGEFPAIVNISSKTACIIDNLNQHRDSKISIQEIKDNYKETGKRLENSNDISDVEDFKLLREVVDDLKHAQLTMKQEHAQQKAIDNQLTKSNMDMEMVQ